MIKIPKNDFKKMGEILTKQSQELNIAITKAIIAEKAMLESLENLENSICNLSA